MERNIIPYDIQQFLLEHIDSVAQWEGVLLLRTNAQMEWDAKTLATRLYIQEADAVSLLDQLTAQGFLAASKSRPPLYRYQPKSSELEQMIERTAALYAHYLVPITHFIHSKPKTRIQKFADAFKIRKD